MRLAAVKPARKKLVSGALVETDPCGCQLGVAAAEEGCFPRGATWHLDFRDRRNCDGAERLRNGQTPAAARGAAERRGRSAAEIGGLDCSSNRGGQGSHRAARSRLAGSARGCRQDECSGYSPRREASPAALGSAAAAADAR